MTDEVPEIKDPQAVLDALERAKADAKKFREELDAMRSEVTELEKTRDSLTETLKTYEDSDSKWKARTKDLAIKSHLGTNAERLMKFLDTDSITFDDDGQVQGIEEAVSKVKADLPELFDPKKRVGGAADLFDKGTVDHTPTGTEAQVSRIFRGR